MTALAIPKREDPEDQQFRQFVRRIRCVACQATEGITADGEYIDQEIDYTPELVYVSDPSHVTSRGAGGVDKENIVPMCRQHHNEWHSWGALTFQTRYNLDMPQIAIEVYGVYEAELERQDAYKEGQVVHQQLLERISSIRKQTLEFGEALLEFSERKIAGRPLYECMGFDSIMHYIQTPIGSGGLGLAGRTAYRWLSLAEMKRQLPEADVEEMGPVKADTVLPVIKQANTQEEKLRLYKEFEPLTNQDAISKVHQIRGTEDPRDRRHSKVKEEIAIFIDSIGGSADDHAIDSLAWKLMGICGR